MNIHINKEQFLNMKNRIILSIEFGSKLYGLGVSSSDKDVLHIISKDESEINSFLWNHHNFQYKEDGVDHVLTTIQNFISNILKGDSTVNFECLFSKEFKESELSWITNFDKDFMNYSLMRSYLGIARRDLNQFLKKKDVKKMYHGLRGIFFFKMIRDNNFSLILGDEELGLLRSIRSGLFDEKELKVLCENNLKLIEGYRIELSKSLDSGRIHRLMDAEKLKELDSCLISYLLKRKTTSSILDEVYSSISTDVKYE